MAVEEALVVTVVVSEVEEAVSEVETAVVTVVEIVGAMVVDTRWEEGKLITSFTLVLELSEAA